MSQDSLKDAQRKEKHAQKRKERREESEDDSESEEEDVNPHKKKKDENRGGLAFIDQEAGEASDETDDDDEFEEGYDAIPKQPTTLLPLAPSTKKTTEDMVERIQKKYVGNETGDQELLDDDIIEDDIDRDIDEEERGSMQRQVNLPTPRDPKLFMVSCTPGREKETIFNILQKSFNFAKLGKPFLILSAVSLENLKGKVYIEAHKELHVKDAVRGISGLSEQKITLVPIPEMPSILTFERKGISLKKDDWVRVRRGIYKGDLSQVVDVDESRSVALCKMIPRLESGSKKKKLFNENDYSGIQKKKDSRTGEYYSIHGGKRYKDGYIFKWQKFITLDIKNVTPTLDEITQFHQGTTTDDSIPQNLGSKKKVTFRRGDEVIVVEGELKDLMGTVYDVNDEFVTVLPRHDQLKDPLQFPSAQLQKHFEIGDYCRVVGGKFDGSTGPIVNIEKDMVILYNEILGQELQVFTRDIRKMSELTTSGDVTLGDYALHDLVRLDGNSTGVIVKMEKDGFKILDNNGNLQAITVQEMGKKITTRASFYKTSDKNGTFVGVGETIRVTEGPFAKREGLIKHVFKGFLFCHSREVMENSGIFVVRAKSCELIGENKQSLTVNDKGVKSGPKSTFQLKYKKYHHEDTDKLVRITMGNFKGYLGVVKDANDSNATILLQSTFKKVVVPIREGVKGYVLVHTEKEETRNRPVYAPMTPWDSSHSRTPSRDSVQTPSHEGGRTPNPYEYPETPRTPSQRDPWDAKSTTTTTPRWEDKPITPSVRTPYSPFPQKNPITPGTISNTPMMYNTPYGGRPPITPGNQFDSRPITPGSTVGYKTQTPESSMYPPKTPGTYGTSFGQSPISQPRNQQILEEVPLDVGVDVEVVGGTYDGMRGGVVKIGSGKTSVQLVVNDDQKIVDILASQLKPTIPKKGDTVRVVRGKDKGKTGTLSSVLLEDGDVVFKNSENSKDILYLKLVDLVKLVKQ